MSTEVGNFADISFEQQDSSTITVEASAGLPSFEVVVNEVVEESTDAAIAEYVTPGPNAADRACGAAAAAGTAAATGAATGALMGALTGPAAPIAAPAAAIVGAAVGAVSAWITGEAAGAATKACARARGKRQAAKLGQDYDDDIYQSEAYGATWPLPASVYEEIMADQTRKTGPAVGRPGTAGAIRPDVVQAVPVELARLEERAANRASNIPAVAIAIAAVAGFSAYKLVK